MVTASVVLDGGIVKCMVLCLSRHGLSQKAHVRDLIGTLTVSTRPIPTLSFLRKFRAEVSASALIDPRGLQQNDASAHIPLYESFKPGQQSMLAATPFKFSTNSNAENSRHTADTRAYEPGAAVHARYRLTQRKTRVPHMAGSTDSVSADDADTLMLRSETWCHQPTQH